MTNQEYRKANKARRFRRGTEATIAFRNRKGGPMESHNTRRARTRAAQTAAAIREAA